jgi:hypothetical protein
MPSDKISVIGEQCGGHRASHFILFSIMAFSAADFVLNNWEIAQ